MNKVYLFRKVNGDLLYLMLMTSLGKTAFPSFGRALLVLLISFSCLMMQVTAVFPPEVFSAYMCRTALLTKLSTRLFQVFHVMEVYAKELSSCYALVGSSLNGTKLHASNTGYATLISTLVTSFCPGHKKFPPFRTGWPAKLSHHGLLSGKGL